MGLPLTLTLPAAPDLDSVSRSVCRDSYTPLDLLPKTAGATLAIKLTEQSMEEVSLKIGSMTVTHSAYDSVEDLRAITKRTLSTPCYVMLSCRVRLPVLRQVALVLFLAAVRQACPGGAFGDQQPYWLRLTKEFDWQPAKPPSMIVLEGVYSQMDRLRVGNIQELLTAYRCPIVLIHTGMEPLRTAIDEFNIQPDYMAVFAMGGQ